MVLDEFFWEPETNEGGGLISVVQGAFAFVSGQAAKVEEDALRIEMPTMTIGVRGTKVAGFAAAEGEHSRVALLTEDDGTVGQIMVSTNAGSFLVTEANMMVESVSRYLEPLEPVAVTTDVLHHHFSGALTILPAAAPKPGEGFSVPEFEIETVNEARAENRDAAVEFSAPPAAEQEATSEETTFVAEVMPSSDDTGLTDVEFAVVDGPVVVENVLEDDEDEFDDIEPEPDDADASDDPAPTANSAPILTTSGAPVLSAIVEDASAPPGDTVAAIVIDGSITDADGGVEAIAVTAVDEANGAWQFSIDGGVSFSAVGPVSVSAARLLDGTAIIRFVPRPDANGTATFEFKAWDQSTGASGDAGIDTRTSTAFSAAMETAEVTITAVNDAPVLDPSGMPVLTGVPMGATAPPGDTVAAIVIDGSISDVDGAVEAIAVTGVDDTNGTWEYSTDGGASFTGFGTVTDTAAVLLDATALVRFVPDSTFTGNAAFTYKAWDQSSGDVGQSGIDTTVGTAFSVAGETAAVLVAPPNNAPVLDTSGSPTLAAIAEDTAAPAGDTVASIVIDGSITDADGAVEADRGDRSR